MFQMEMNPDKQLINELQIKLADCERWLKAKTDEKQKRVYIITAGEYSDYRILGVVDDNKELADHFADKWGGTANEWHVNSQNDVLKGKTRYQVIMAYDGTLLRVWESPSPDLKTESQILNWDNKFRLEVFCWATDKKHAVKISNEIRAHKIALGEWDEWVNAGRV